MGVWSEWDDPIELRMRLDAALVEIAELTEENDRLRRRFGLPVRGSLLEGHGPAIADDQLVAMQAPRSNGLPYADASSPAEEKLALFRALFAGRTDVYARRWVSSRTGRAGWSPVEENPWDKSKPDVERVFFPLSNQVIFRHLSRPGPGQRELHAGLRAQELPVGAEYRVTGV